MLGTRVFKEASKLIETDLNEKLVRDIMELCFQLMSDFSRDDLVSGIGGVAAKIATVLAERDESGGRWHCVAGRDFGAWISHEKYSFVHFSLWDIQVLLFKHG